MDGGGRFHRRGALGEKQSDGGVSVSLVQTKRSRGEWSGAVLREEQRERVCVCAWWNCSTRSGGRSGGVKTLGVVEPASNPAEVVRGRRGDEGGDWRGDSHGVTAPRAVKHRARGLGVGDARVIDGRLAFEPGLTET